MVSVAPGMSKIRSRRFSADRRSDYRLYRSHLDCDFRPSLVTEYTLKVAKRSAFLSARTHETLCRPEAFYSLPET